MNNDINGFLEELASGSPTPGGGGASSLAGAVGVALGGMVANLTTGKKKYAQYQQDIDVILWRAEELRKTLVQQIDDDAAAFEPLAKAYAIPKDNPSRDVIMEDALRKASEAPFAVLTTLQSCADIVVELSVKGSKLAISDVGCAAALISAAAKGTVMNIYINTKLMGDREYAENFNLKSIEIVKDITSRCDEVYNIVSESLDGAPI